MKYDQMALGAFLLRNGYMAGGYMKDGRVCFIRGTAADQGQVCISLSTDDNDGISDTYSYEDMGEALIGWAAWVGRRYEGEPNGWIRHQPSDRRRLNGDPSTEEVRP